MPPLVSILIPAYNAEKWIRDTLRSAIGQSWINKQIVLVDDGSTDRTAVIAREFANDGVTVVSQTNQGAAAARNYALSLAQGDYIQWLDADDLLSPDKIATQIAAAAKCESKRTLFSSGWGYFMYRLSRTQFSPSTLWCDLPPVEWLIRKWEGNFHMQPATWLVSRELTTTAGRWDTRLTFDDDGEYFFRIITASDGIKFVPEAKVYYRITGPNRLSNIGQSGKKLDSQFLSMKTQIAALRALEDNARSRAACVNYLQTWLTYFHPERPDIVEEAKQLAATLDGHLTSPRLSWKYAWIQKLFGWTAAKRAQLSYNKKKTSLLRSWDKTMHRLEANVV